MTTFAHPTPPGHLAWMDRAACAGMESDIFFPRNQHAHPVAKATCARCPVRANCLASALAVEVYDDIGYWGGTTRQERLVIRDNPRLLDEALHLGGLR